MNEYLTTDELCGFTDVGFEDEQWSVIPGYSNYYISTKGRVWNITSGKFLNPCLNSYGYLIVHLCLNEECKNFKIHRLMAEQFIANPYNYPVVRHLDDNKLNNDINNLSWGTQSDNLKDAVRNGKCDNILRPIIAINNDTGIGRYFESCFEASRWLGCNYTSVGDSLVKGCNICGYRIEDADPKYLHEGIQSGGIIRHLFPTQKMRRPNKSTKVKCTRCDNGEKMIFDNVIEVVRFFDSPYSTIINAIHEKRKHKGYYIEYDY